MSVDSHFIRGCGERLQNALTVVDVRDADQPLIYINQRFCDLTGYDEAEILGRNCRFLQGPGTDPEDVKRVRLAIKDGLAVFCDLLNYKKDGTPFCNRLVLLPILTVERPCFIGMQIDATELVEQHAKAGRSFDRLKTSEVIKDRINNPLMRILLALTMDTQPEEQGRLLASACQKILDTVQRMPYLQA